VACFSPHFVKCAQHIIIVIGNEHHLFEKNGAGKKPAPQT